MVEPEPLQALLQRHAGVGALLGAAELRRDEHLVARQAGVGDTLADDRVDVPVRDQRGGVVVRGSVARGGLRAGRVDVGDRGDLRAADGPA